MILTEIIAHRGASAYSRENTLSAYKMAVEQGADMIELDVRKTRDNVLISYHHSHFDGQAIQNLTYKKISVLSQKKGFKIPTLENVLKFAQGKIRLDIELKEEGYEKTVVELIKGYLKEHEFVITSFNDLSLKAIKEISPVTKVGMILGRKKTPDLFKTRFSEIFPRKRYIQTRSDYLIVHWKLIKFGVLNRMATIKIPIMIWTLNEPKMIIKCLKDNRITGIITDKPDLVFSLRAKLNSNQNMV